jgi:hypothetical protein
MESMWTAPMQTPTSVSCASACAARGAVRVYRDIRGSVGDSENAGENTDVENAGPSAREDVVKNALEKVSLDATEIAVHSADDDKNQCSFQRDLLRQCIDHVLTGELMTDPVIAEDGRTYERAAIERYFESLTESDKEIKSPFSRKPMGSSLVSNEEVRALTDKFQLNLSPACSASWHPEHNIKSLYDVGNFMAWLDPFREVLDSSLDGWTPPCVILIGSENSGKSSVFERLTLMSIFPRSEGICTRLPIHAQMRRTAVAQPPTMIVFNVDTQKVVSREVIPLNQGCVEVRRAMEDVLRLNGGQLRGISTSHIIILEIRSPRVPSIDLIDMPGIVAASTADEPSDLPAETQLLLEKYLKQYGDRSMYLCVCPATITSNKDIAYGIMQSKSLEARTLGVVTMCDLKRTNTRSRNQNAIDKAAIADVAGPSGLGGVSSVPLKPHGYVCLVNTPEEGDSNVCSDNKTSLEVLLEQSEYEMQFFRDNGLGSLIDQRRAGANALVERINHMYSSYLQETWIPRTILLATRRIEKLTRLIKEVGVPVFETKDFDSIRMEFHVRCQEQVKQTFLKRKKAEVNAVAETLVTSAMEGFSAEKGVVSHDDIDYARIPELLNEFQVQMTDILHRGVTSIKQGWCGKSFASIMSQDESAFKFGRFSCIIAVISKSFHSKLNGIYEVAMNRAVDCLRTHITVPSSTVEVTFQGRHLWELSIRSDRIINDCVYCLIGGSLPLVIDALEQSVASVIQGLGRETIIEDSTATELRDQYLLELADLTTVKNRLVCAGAITTSYDQWVKDRLQSIVVQNEDELASGLAALRARQQLTASQRDALLTRGLVLQQGMLSQEELATLQEVYSKVKPSNSSMTGAALCGDWQQRYALYRRKQLRSFTLELIKSYESFPVDHQLKLIRPNSKVTDTVAELGSKRITGTNLLESLTSIDLPFSFDALKPVGTLLPDYYYSPTKDPLDQFYSKIGRYAAIDERSVTYASLPPPVTLANLRLIADELSLGYYFSHEQHVAFSTLKIGNSGLDYDVLVDIFSRQSVVVQGIGIYGGSQDVMSAHVLIAWQKILSVSAEDASVLCKEYGDIATAVAAKHLAKELGLECIRHLIEFSKIR